MIYEFNIKIQSILTNDRLMILIMTKKIGLTLF